MASHWTPRRLLDEASEKLDAVLRPSYNQTADEAREDAFHDKIIKEVTADESHELVAAFSMTVMLTILLLVIIVGATIKHYNVQWLHQSGAALLLGVLVGFVVSYVRQDPMYQENTRESQRMTAFVEWIMFDTEFFFLVLLPPVIFESGYTLNPEKLFKNFDAIAVFAFLGTFTSTVVVGFIMYVAGTWGVSFPFTLRDAMLFASLISSTDPVTTLCIFNDMGMDPDLHAIILGESLLNDAISIVLFEALFSLAGAGAGAVTGGAGGAAVGLVDIQSQGASIGQSAIGAEVAFSELAVSSLGVFLGVFFASLVIGGIVGACSAMLHKYISITGDWDEGWVIDSSLVLIFPYLAYTIAESANLSGIVAVLFCGMVMGRYTRQNLDKAPRMVTMCFFKLVAFLSETFVFIYMGSSMCTISVTHLVTAVISLFAVFIGRAANVFPGAYLLNRTSRPSQEYDQITTNVQLCMWYCGLRGAVAYALAMKAAATLGAPGQAMLSSTLFVVMFTVLLLGGSTHWALQHLGIIDGASKLDPMSPTTPTSEKPQTGGHRGGRGGGQGRPSKRFHALRQFDFKYLQPLLLAVPMKRIQSDGGGKGGGRHDTGKEGEFGFGTVGRDGGRGGGEGGRGDVDTEERVPIMGGGVFNGSHRNDNIGAGSDRYQTTGFTPTYHPNGTQTNLDRWTDGV